MGLTRRIIPYLDIKDGRVVKGVNFENLRDAGNPVELARTYNDQDADEGVLLDVTASKNDRQTMIDVISQAADQLFLLLTVGEGIKTSKDIRDILQDGNDKMSLNTSAIQMPGGHC
jgi:cyclase